MSQAQPGTGTQLVLHDEGAHYNVRLEVADVGDAVPVNQYVITHGKAGIALDLGGTAVLDESVAGLFAALRGASLRYLFVSHVDPDVVSAIDDWLALTEATVVCPEMWVPYLPHAGLRSANRARVLSVPEEGTVLDLDGSALAVLPAPFLHAPGTIQLFDPAARVLYTGDLASSFVRGVPVVPDFEAHVPALAHLHRDLMGGRRAMQAWARMVRRLDVAVLAPSHGPLFVGREMVARFLDWAEGFECGTDLLPDELPVPKW